jgi:hypothetical protein
MLKGVRIALRYHRIWTTLPVCLAGRSYRLHPVPHASCGQLPQQFYPSMYCLHSPPQFWRTLKKKEGRPLAHLKYAILGVRAIRPSVWAICAHVSHSVACPFPGFGSKQGGTDYSESGRRLNLSFGLSCACFSLSRIPNPWVWGKSVRSHATAGWPGVRTSCLDFLGMLFFLLSVTQPVGLGRAGRHQLQRVLRVPQRPGQEAHGPWGGAVLQDGACRRCRRVCVPAAWRNVAFAVCSAPLPDPEVPLHGYYVIRYHTKCT